MKFDYLAQAVVNDWLLSVYSGQLPKHSSRNNSAGNSLFANYFYFGADVSEHNGDTLVNYNVRYSMDIFDNIIAVEFRYVNKLLTNSPKASLSERSMVGLLNERYD